jgi:acyl carrier protein
MNREEVLAMVLRHAADAVDGLIVGNIDPARSMRDQGLSSLDTVEVVTRSMRDLKVKIPRAQLRKLATINELVDALDRAVAARNR